MKRAVIFGFGKSWEVTAIQRVIERQGWCPVYWQVAQKYEKSIKRKYPEVIVHRAKAVRQFEKPVEFSHLDWPRSDPEVVKAFACHEPVLWPSFLRKVPPGRWAGGLDLKDEFHRVLTFRYHLFRELRPDIVVFGNVPSGLPQFLFYVIARHLGVQTLVMRRVLFSERNIAFLIQSMEEGSTQIRDRYQELLRRGEPAEVELSPEMEDRLKRLSGSYVNRAEFTGGSNS